MSEQPQDPGASKNESPTVRLPEAAAFVQKKIVRHIGDCQCDAEVHFWERPTDRSRICRELHQVDPVAADRLERALAEMPEPGMSYCGFHLLAEIGRGAVGRVFLAEQDELARRRVVVKVAPGIWGEATTLAQLQHPNIVPIFSVHQVEPFQSVCMPYLGWTTFQDVLTEIRSQPALPASGEIILKAYKGPPIANLEAMNETRTPFAEPASALAKMSYVEAIVWLATQLADGLAHAHEHGIIHHDLKPANILLADDGTPMLLDFNAACDTKQSGSVVAWVAGTLPYFAPEQLIAFDSKELLIDSRGDIYSLGVILFELLTGRYPFKQRNPELSGVFDRILTERLAPPPMLRNLNPAITPAVEAIIRRCLEPDPARRYQTARELHEDLFRQHTHRPLRHVAEPSLHERMQKWSRRHPRGVAAIIIGSVAAVLLTTICTLWVVRSNQLQQLAAKEQERVREFTQRDAARAARRQFESDLRTAQFLLYTRTNEPEQLAEGVAIGRKLVRNYGVLGDSPWQQADLVTALSKNEQRRLGDEMAELLLLTARALMLQHADDVAKDAREAAHQEARQMNQRAAECSTAVAESPALWQQRAKLTGNRDEADRYVAKAKAMPLRTAADHYWLASDQMANGDLRNAMPLLQKATALEPSNFWAWFVLGNCCDRLALDARAEACYATCVALKPEFVWAHFNRGLARFRQQDYRLACDDFDAVAMLRPETADAYLNRALCRQGLLQFKDAEEDLTTALKYGGPTRLYFLRARVREKLGNKSGAQSDIAEALRLPPSDEKSWVARGVHHLNRDPKSALADFEQALRLNPRSADALQNKAHVLAEKMGKDKESLQALNKLIELYPDSVKARNGRGVVLARLGEREAAVRDAEETLRRDASPPRLYQVACIYALTSKQQPDDRHKAMQLLSSALRSGYGFQYLAIDTDLDPLRGLPEFRSLMDASRALRPPPAKSK